MSSDVREQGAVVTDRRADIARLQLRLRQAKRRLAEAERDTPVDAETARSALVAQLGPMLDQRRLSMDAELETARAAADRRRDEATREAVEIVERAERTVRERALRDQAQATLRAQAAREQAEVALRDQQERHQAEAAAREQAEAALREQHARERRAHEQTALDVQARDDAEVAQREHDERQRASQALHDQTARARQRAADQALLAAIPTAAPILPPHLLPFVQIVDASGAAGPVPTAPPSLPASPGLAPSAAMTDPEVFARAVATVLAAVVGERGAQPQQVVVQAPVAPNAGFWASARHLDVLLLGLTTVIVLVVLAAWLA